MQYILAALINGSFIAMLAVGFALVYNTTRIFHIAYAALYTLSGYLFYQFFEIFELPFVFALLLSIIITSAISLSCDLLIYRPLIFRKTGLHALMVASIAILIIIINVIILIWGNSPLIISPADLLSGYYFGITGNRLVFLMIYLILIITTIVIIRKTSFISVIRAIRDNTDLTSVLGINVSNYRSKTFIYSGILVGIVGALNSFDIGINPGVGLPVFIYAFIALIVGGSGKPEGAIVGGFFIGILQTVAEYFISSQWVLLSIFIILLGFLFYLPKGLLPEKGREL